MNRKTGITIAVACAMIAALFLIIRLVSTDGSGEELVPVKPARGDMMRTVSTVGTVKPQNRLEIKPPIGGRIEKILVTEGQQVKLGDVLAMMSSTDRATLIDAARMRGEDEHRYWQNAYKETPLIAPIDGEVIVRSVEPGQTVSTADAVLVLSDRLIVKADVDETDIGELKVGQRATVGLDAYPEIKIGAVVDHISYESEVVSNVTIYKVDILPEETPEIFRSGMSANVEIAVREAKGALMVPSEAVEREGNSSFVKARVRGDDHMKTVEVATGIEQNGFVEIISGLSDEDTIFTPKRSQTALKKKKNSSSPFMPSFARPKEKQPEK
ncbi:MAG: efflux RND transporter periplasmic adaptor subunit [Proteobacteria bacterium]|nr:efflux RND transporter periplasmic adaptor subunit [Pseudomonadota bacterium]